MQSKKQIVLDTQKTQAKSVDEKSQKALNRKRSALGNFYTETLLVEAE